jgi:arylsulfatase A-like enzyme
MKNVILMTLDACRKDVFGCYGNSAGLTPFIDSLKGNLLTFTRAQATGPYTQASFPSILTSSYYLEFGWQQRCPAQRIFISEVLRNHGIATAAFHSNPYLSAYFGWNRGWDLFMDSMKDPVTPKVPFLKGRMINERAGAWLSSLKKSGVPRPFLLWIHYMDTHEPYIPDRKYLELVDPALDLSEEDMFLLFKEVLLKRDASDENRVALLRKLYHAHVREVDGYARDFFGILESLDLLKNTTVIITSDHGDEFGEHGGLSHDDKLYSELIDVPLLLCSPEIKGGEDCHAVVSNIDIPPTIVHLFGLDPVAAFEGKSLLPIEGYSSPGCFGEAIHQVKGKGGDIGKDVYYYMEDDLKIIYRANLDAWEMYDLMADPRERTNIVESSPMAEVLKGKLRPRVRRWKKALR